MSDELLKAALESDSTAPLLLPTDEPIIAPPIEDEGKPLRTWQWREFVEEAKKRHIAEKREEPFDSHKLLKSLGLRAPVSRYRVTHPKYQAIEIDAHDPSEAIRRFYAHHNIVNEMEAVQPAVTNIEHTLPRPAAASKK